ncbi:MAG TPA: M1 family metallopeptidase, partial [Candidatus Kapabacteria bacterium]|nr:M1 family metallopeptidase [Candidatus Kapabacteria bacterium]
MKKNLFLFIIIVLASGTSFATSGSVFLWHREAGASTQAFPTFPKRPFDVKSYNLTLDWRKPFVVKSQQFSGKNIITLRLTDAGTTSIVLDAALLVIDTVFVGSQHILPTPQPDTNEQITIPLATAFRQDTADLIISISYHRTDVSSRGAFFYPKNTFVGLYRNVDSIFTTEDIIYTMSEPLDAHAWMPCMDLPYDKADYEVSIIVPNGITTASNGALLAKTSVDANSTLWHWKSDRPMSTYLMVADASNFIQWGETHHRSSDPADTVSLVYYAWPADYYQDSITDGSKYNAKHSFRNTSWIMSNYESRYGPYPFEKYGQVPAQRFDFGGQEHQTLTTINRSWLRNNEQGMAHEMSHHWFGDKVTCETFKDIWLNEGFATFSEAIWYEGWGGYSNYIGNIRSDALQYFSSAYSDVPIYDPPGADDMFNLGSTVLYYPKAACVIHMLRRIIRNDTMFFAALRDYTDHFAYSTATTDEFRDFMSARLGIDLTEFIDEWIYGPGHVKYAITWGQSKSGFLMINVAQGQSWRDHFTMPLQFFAYHGKLVDTLRFTNNARTQEFFAGLPYKLDSLGFDTDALVLSEYTVAFDPALGVQSALATDDLGGRTVFDRSNNSLIYDLNTPAQNDDRLELY